MVISETALSDLDRAARHRAERSLHPRAHGYVFESEAEWPTMCANKEPDWLGLKEVGHTFATPRMNMSDPWLEAGDRILQRRQAS